MGGGPQGPAQMTAAQTTQTESLASWRAGGRAGGRAGTLTAHSLCFPLWLLLPSPQEGEEQAGKPGIHHLSALPVGEGLKGQESREGVCHWPQSPCRVGKRGSPGWGVRGRSVSCSAWPGCVLADLLY